MKALFSVFVFAALYSPLSFAIIDRWDGYPKQVKPPGCLNHVKLADGLFACDRGQISVQNGWVRINGQKLCAFTEPSGVQGVVFLEIDNRSATFTDEYVCTRTL